MIENCLCEQVAQAAKHIVAWPDCETNSLSIWMQRPAGQIQIDSLLDARRWLGRFVLDLAEAIKYRHRNKEKTARTCFVPSSSLSTLH